MVKKIILMLVSLAGLFSFSFSQDRDSIRLLVRADDIGSSRNANEACILTYQKGIVRSVELMVPCPWFPEAVKLLNENPGLDVGIHLVLTSEWDNYKWRPITGPSTITDPDGYFFPMVWPNENYPENKCLKHSGYNMLDIEKELRAQIELAMNKIPHISHLSNHMGWTSMGPELEELYHKLAKDYGLETDLTTLEYAGSGYDNDESLSGKDNFINMLKNLKPGTYIFVEHPGLDTPEARGIFHTGYENVAEERQAVTDLFTDADVMKTIKDKNINLIGYKDLKK